MDLLTKVLLKIFTSQFLNNITVTNSIFLFLLTKRSIKWLMNELRNSGTHSHTQGTKQIPETSTKNVYIFHYVYYNQISTIITDKRKQMLYYFR